MSATNPSVERFAESAEELYKNNKMVVFLCGPTLKDIDTKSSAKLRKRLQDRLQAEGFEVVLGEDDGLENVRLKISQGYAHDNELNFIKEECSAIVLVADSIGSFCELGLFVHWATYDNSQKCDFILIADSQYKDHISYFNEGPARAVSDFGATHYVNFDQADIEPILKRLRGRRSVQFNDRRGRPAKNQ